MSEALAVAELGEGGLRHVDDHVGEVGGRDRAAVGEARNPHRAVLAQQHLDAAHGAGVGRQVLAEAGEHALHRRHGGRGLGQVEAGVDAVDVVAQVHRHPRLVGVDVDRHVDRDPLRHPGLDRVVRQRALELALGQRADGLDAAALGIVEPFLGEVPHRVGAVLGDEGLDRALADAGRADGGEIVAVPLLGHADAALAHADDVVDVLEIPLHLHAGEDQRAFLIDVRGLRHVGGGQAVADIGLMGLHRDGEEVLPLVEHGHQDGVIGRMRVAEIGVVVQVRIALGIVGMQVLHRLGLDVGAPDVDGEALGHGEHLIVRRDDRTREVARHADDGGPRRQQHGVGHLAADRVHAVRHHRQQNRVDAVLPLRFRECLCHRSLPQAPTAPVSSR